VTDVLRQEGSPESQSGRGDQVVHVIDARVRAVVEEARAPVHTVVLDAAAMDDIDYTGADVLRRLAEDFERKGTRLVITELSPAAGATLERTGLGEVLSVVPRLESAVGQTP
jgi:anti-anti-sigma factor